MNSTFLSIIVAALLIGGAFLLTQNNSSATNTPPANNVTIVDGKQIVEITAKGGHSPRTSSAKAGIPTVIRFQTNGTFDCSSSIRIPSMGVSKNLPPTGTIDIDIIDPQPGPLTGMCGMGMYPFTVNFQS